MSDIVLCAPLYEELPGDDQGPGENEREHRGGELTGIIHRKNFSVIGRTGNAGRPSTVPVRIKYIAAFSQLLIPSARSSLNS